MYCGTVNSSLFIAVIHRYELLCMLEEMKQYVWFAHKQNVILPEFDKINVIKEMLNVKYDFASVPVLDLAEIVYSIEFLCTE